MRLLAKRNRGTRTMAIAAILFLSLPRLDVLAAGGDYVLGSGDQVRITVYPGDIPAIITRVSQDGLVSFPMLGQVRIGGMTERKAEAKIRSALETQRLVQSPQVILLVEEQVSHQVSIVGKVSKPGKYPFTPGTTVVDILANAGGTSADGSDRVIVTRKSGKGKKTFVVDIASVLQDGDISLDIEVQANDKIYVPRQEVFYIYGEVAKPGSYPLYKHMTVMQALSVSGGLTDKGTDRGVKIKRGNKEGKSITSDASLTEVLKPNDVVFVKESLF